MFNIDEMEKVPARLIDEMMEEAKSKGIDGIIDQMFELLDKEHTLAPRIFNMKCSKPTKKLFAMLSSRALVDGLTFKYMQTNDVIPSVELLPYQKTQIEDLFVIGTMDTEILKNGSKLTLNALDFKTYEKDNKTFVTNLLVSKIMRHLGHPCEFLSDKSTDEYVQVSNSTSIDGLYKVKELSLLKLLHNYNTSTDDLRKLAMSLDYTDNFTSALITTDQLDKFRRLIISISDNIEKYCKVTALGMEYKNPKTLVTKYIDALEGKDLDDIINYTVDDLSKLYNGINIDDTLVEIEFRSAEDIEHGTSFFTDTYQIGGDEELEFVNTSVYAMNMVNNIGIQIRTEDDKKSYYTNFCGIPHKIDTINCGLTEAIITLNCKGKSKLVVDEKDFKLYGIYDSYHECMNAKDCSYNAEIIKLRLDEKEIDFRLQKLEMDIISKEFLSRTKMITALLKLANDTSSKNMLIEKLKYEKAVADNGMADLDKKIKGFNLVKDIGATAMRLAV